MEKNSRNSDSIKSVFYYVFSLVVLTIVVWYVYGKNTQLINDLSSNKCQLHSQFLIFAVLMHLVNHFLRALRWKLLLGHLKRAPSLFHMFLAEMSGFFFNLMPFRPGEALRCGILEQLAGVPLSKLLSTVILERVLELVAWIAVLVLAYAWCREDVLYLFGNTFGEVSSKLASCFTNQYEKLWLGVLGLILLLFVCAVLLVHFLLSKIERFLLDLKKTARYIYWTHAFFAICLVSLLVLIFHISVEFFSFYAICDVGRDLLDFDLLKKVLILFLVINFSMAIPMPGGAAGFYHSLVGKAFVSLRLGSVEMGARYATITHSVQVFNALFLGGLCFLLASCLLPRARVK